jgi:hypothetical protein
MSINIVSDAHISAILRFGFGPEWSAISFRNRLQNVADMLKADNTHSYNERYVDDQTMVEPCVIDFTQAERSPVEVLKLIQCYELNCSELGTYAGDSAADEVRAIRDKAIRQLAGYSAAEWEIY